MSHDVFAKLLHLASQLHNIYSHILKLWLHDDMNDNFQLPSCQSIYTVTHRFRISLMSHIELGHPVSWIIRVEIARAYKTRGLMSHICIL